MLRLILIRHAKSGWDNPELADHDRPLAPRGRKAAVWLGDTLRTEGWVPDLILCSTALRTRETVELAALGVETRFERAIYDHMGDDFVDIIRTGGGVAPVLALVGHNSGMDTTGLLLAEDDTDFGGFVTGAFAVFDFHIDRWSELRQGTGRLVAFREPRKG